jgi:hypothetical protein
MWIGIGLLAFGVLVRALLPLGARMAIERYAGDALGRRVDVWDVDFGLLFGRATVKGIVIGGPDRVAPISAGDAVVTVGSVAAQIAWLPLLQQKIHVREIALVEPAVRLERNPDGSLAPIVLAPPAPAPETPPEPEPEGGGLDLAIDRFSLDKASVALVRHSDQEGIAELRFENFTVGDLTMQEGVFGVGAVSLRGPDLAIQAKSLEAEESAEPAPAEPAAEPAPGQPAPPPRHRVKDLNIESAKFAWRTADGEVVDAELELHAQNLGIGAERFPFEIRLDTERAKLNLEGEVAFQPVSFEGEFRWRDLQLPKLTRVARAAAVTMKSGRSDGELKISLRLEDADGARAGVKLSGRAAVADLDLATTDESVALKWKQLDAELASFAMTLGETPGAPQIELAKLALVQPDVAYRVQEAAAAAAPEAPADAAPAPASGEASPPPRVLVRDLQVSGGKLAFADTSVRPGVKTGLSDVKLRAQNVRWPERDIGKLDLAAKGARGSSLKIAGSVKGGAGNVDVDLKEFPLSPFDPYASRATGLKIDEGRLSLAAKLALDPKRMGAKSTVSLHKLSISERESGWFQKAFGVPLDVAIALLQDLEGNITLPVNVEQDEKGTSVGVGAAVTAALRQALVGALAAPLKLLGSVAGVGGAKGGEASLSAGLEPIEMSPGLAALPADADERMASLAKLLASRPGLGVLLIGRAGTEDDGEIARRTVLARARADQPLPGEEKLGFFERRRVKQALAGADPNALDSLDAESATALTQLSAAVAVDEGARQELARERAQQVQRALQEQHGAPAEAVHVETESGAPGVVIELKTQ